MIVEDYLGYAVLLAPVQLCFRMINLFPFMLVFPWLTCSIIKKPEFSLLKICQRITVFSIGINVKTTCNVLSFNVLRHSLVYQFFGLPIPVGYFPRSSSPQHVSYTVTQAELCIFFLLTKRVHHLAASISQSSVSL